MNEDETPELDEAEIRSRLARALGEQYVVRALVGRGGFADVYEVWDEELHRRLAVKVLRPDLAWTAGMLSRFKQEARAVARLNHPNVLPIHFVGQAEDIVYYAMPFVEGRSLGDALRERNGSLSVDWALEVILPILDALEHAHERGLVHRDIKPDNVMLDATTGRPMLVDFGIVKRLDGGVGQTATGYVVGSPRYMSPEQALGHTDIDRRADLYSLGAMLFQMVTGSPPYEGDTSQRIVAKHISASPPVASERHSSVPAWLSDVIVRCMAKTPAQRYQSAAEVRRALIQGAEIADPNEAGRGSAGGGGGGAAVSQEITELVATGEQPTVQSPAQRPSRRKWVLVAAVAAVVIAAWLGAMVTRRPALVMENRLVEPVRLTLDGGDVRVIDPGEEISVPLDPGRPLMAHWTLVQPTTPSGAVMGVSVEGTIVDSHPRGTVRAAARSWPADSAFFAPLITNATDRPLAVIVNAGVGGAMRCGCIIAPGATRAAIGYYPLYTNSTVRVEDAEGRAATFEDLGAQVDLETGTVGLRFETKDLRD